MATSPPATTTQHLNGKTLYAREDNWTCLQRLATEVGWRCVSGTVYFTADQDLLASQPRMMTPEPLNVGAPRTRQTASPVRGARLRPFPRIAQLAPSAPASTPSYRGECERLRPGWLHRGIIETLSTADAFLGGGSASDRGQGFLGPLVAGGQDSLGPPDAVSVALTAGPGGAAGSRSPRPFRCGRESRRCPAAAGRRPGSSDRTLVSMAQPARELR